MSRIGLLGASGNLGSHILTSALAAGWEVHALTRDPLRVRRANERLTLFQGDAQKGEGLEAFLGGCRFIVYAINSEHPADCMGHLVKAIGKRRVDRLVLVSRVGAGDSELQGRKVSGVLASLMPRVRKGFYEDVTAAEELLRTSGLPYCIFRATELTDDPPGHDLAAVRAGDRPPARVGRADLARFLVHSLTEPEWHLQEVTVGTRR